MCLTGRSLEQLKFLGDYLGLCRSGALMELSKSGTTSQSPCVLLPADGRHCPPSTLETDYSELVTSYPKEDYSPLGSLSGHDPQVVLPRRPRRADALHQPLRPRAAPAGLQANPRNCDTCTCPSKPLGLCWALVGRNLFLSSHEMGGSPDHPSPHSGSRPWRRQVCSIEPRQWTRGSGSQHWSASWMVLEGSILTYFKDSRPQLQAAGGSLPSSPSLSMQWS
ncbi:Pleckstriny Domain-Containing Family M Member 1 [Manis pentadactyla]|nr:Pleckstriny Domain-Containing Family M Member 1 [Manis pentadactyla]